ncbi:undecaprenyl-diphosphatase 1 [Azorhizobium oxalatiphilum]|uniref:Undecaprenyl-diphosphatase n=1 Tax=Azorhizobium oxalatiphilum TaxID=980631 RepID=A0A917FGP5_9HYPH|nr:undecaprenyl-diphosphate phosphatase [Azorhizobium oxalatiphilum]GGF75900.1 undecaprenyl-diphosphatase 1 [Azorhizobium oxalatiphilum]
MTIAILVKALLLGLLEGATEFLPVSSTGHLLLAAHFLGFESTGKTFEVLIQLGAVLAILVVYFQRFLRVAMQLPTNPGARRFVIGIVLAFLPAAVAGVLLHGFIKQVLFESPITICVALIFGGVVLLFVDRIAFKPRYNNAMGFPLKTALGIGFFQCLALIPGMSRSGSTIVGGLLLGADKRSAAEFSFFLALPTMLGAFVYDFWKNRGALSADDGIIIAVGFVAAFVSALLVIRTLLDFVSRHGYAVFGWWRILVGGGCLALLLLGY